MSTARLCAALRAESIEVETEEAELAAYESDFGRLVRGRALGAIRPKTTSEVARVMTVSRELGVGVTIRCGGASQSGQSVANDTFVLDLSRLRALDGSDLASGQITVEPATTFREILAEALPRGLALPVSPLNLDLCVGGVLSAGGMGSTSHRHGLLVDHVVRAEVVLGTGETVIVDPERHRELYDVVLGGVGRAGILTRVTLRLVPAASALRTTVLLARDLGAALAAQSRLASMLEIEHLDLVCAPAILGLMRTPEGGRAPLRRWSHVLHVTTRAGVDASAWSSDLPDLETVHVESDDAMAFAARFDARFGAMRATGAWEQAHPWFEAFVPASRAREAIERAMAMPPFLAELVRATPVASDARATRPRGLAMPDGPTFVVALLPAGVPPALVPAARQALTSLDDAYAELGAKRYLSGWLPRIAALGWRDHHGASLDVIAGALRRSDPSGTLRSKLPPLRASEPPRALASPASR